MIYIDCKGDKPDNHPGKDLIAHVNRLGIKCEQSDLQYGDVAFEGNGPNGSIAIGIERKTLHDMLNCIDDARYNGQRVGMKQVYTLSVLMLEGHWKPHDPGGILMEGFSGGISWGYCRYRSQRTMYAKLKRYLISVGLAGVIVDYSRDLFNTAYNIHEWYHYFQKKWGDHTSMREEPRIAIPAMNLRASLTRKWATDIEGVGLKLGEQAERIFSTPIKLATADEMQWLRIPGIGVPTAQSIVKQIWGTR